MRLFLIIFQLVYVIYMLVLILGTLALIVIGCIAAVTYFMNGNADWLVFSGIREWFAAAIIGIAAWFVTLTIMDLI